MREVRAVAKVDGERTFYRHGRIAVKDRSAHLAVDIDIPVGERSADANCYLILIEYLSGSNASHQPVALRAPVQQLDDDDWQLTEKSVSTSQPGRTSVRFEFSDDVFLSQLPAPTDPRVHLRRVALSRSATIWFAGQPSTERVASRSQQLRTFISLNNLLPLFSNQGPEIRTAKRGPFQMLTELSLPISEWIPGRAIRPSSSARRGFKM